MSENVTRKSKGTQRSRAWWAEQIETCERSGLSMVAYARANGLKLSSFYNWKTVLRRERNKRAIRRIEKTRPIEFLEVVVSKPQLDVFIEIKSPGGWTVRVPASVDAETTSRFVGVVEGRE